MNALCTTAYCALSGLGVPSHSDTQGFALGHSYFGPSDLFSIDS